MSKKDGCPPGSYRNGGKCIDKKCKEENTKKIESIIPSYPNIDYPRGFILPDGKIIDSAYYSHTQHAEKMGFSSSENLISGCSAVRFTASMEDEDDALPSLLIESVHKPTEKQISTLVKAMKMYSYESIEAERTDAQNHGYLCGLGCGLEWEDENKVYNKPTDIRKWVNRCWG